MNNVQITVERRLMFGHEIASRYYTFLLQVKNLTYSQTRHTEKCNQHPSIKRFPVYEHRFSVNTMSYPLGNGVAFD